MAGRVLAGGVEGGCLEEWAKAPHFWVWEEHLGGSTLVVGPNIHSIGVN